MVCYFAKLYAQPCQVQQVKVDQVNGLALGEVAQPVFCCDTNRDVFLNALLSSSSPSSSWRSSRFNTSTNWDFAGLSDCVGCKWGVSSAAPGVLTPVYSHSLQIHPSDTIRYQSSAHANLRLISFFLFICKVFYLLSLVLFSYCLKDCCFDD